MLDLDGRDVLSAGDDDVLGAVAQFDITVGVLHTQIAGVQPAATEGLLGGVDVVEVPDHHVVAAHHDLAHRAAVARHVDHVLVDHTYRVGLDHRHALAGLAAGLIARRQRGPAGLPLVERIGAVHLGHPVDVHDPRAQLAHSLITDGPGGAPATVATSSRSSRWACGRIGDHRQHRRGAVEVGDALVVEELPDHVRAHGPQAHVRRADRGDRPWGAPAVAVEHRQRPQVDAFGVEPLVDDLSERIQVGAAVRVHHALGGARRPGCVVDRDQARLVLDRPGQRLHRSRAS